MDEFEFQEMFPLAGDRTEYRRLTEGARVHGQARRGRDPQGGARGADAAGTAGVHRRGAPLPSLAPEAAGAGLRGPGELRQRPLRRARAHEERGDRGRDGLPDVPGHRHGHRDRQKGPAGLQRRPRRGGSHPRGLRRLHRRQPALLAERSAQHVRGGQHPLQPARPGGALPRSPATSTASSSSPRAAGRPTRPSCSRKPRPSSTPRPWSTT